MKPKHKKAHSFTVQGLFSNLNSFSDLENRISNLPKKDRGDAFEVFAEAYFKTQARYQACEVWPEKQLPQSLRNKLGIPNDAGVDGIFETYLGFHSYQVKFRTNRTSLTWKRDGLGNFLGQSDRVNERFLFTNSNDLPRAINERANFKRILGNDLDHLNQSDFKAIENWLKTGSVIREKKNPLPHQIQAINDILQQLNISDRTTAIMACGTGKTLVALWVAEKKDAQTILVLLPSLALVRQALHDWARESSWDKFNYLCVCSDATVKVDETILPPHELDFPVTTQKEDVRQYFQNPNISRKIIFSTYQSCQIVAEAMPQSFSFDLAIFDEAHKTASRQGANYAFALQDKNLSIKKRLFLTATPRHYNINKKDKEGDHRLVFSMDDKETYGQIAHQLSFRDAVKKNLICDYKVVISIVASDMVNRELLKKGEVVVEGEIIKAERIANILAIKNAVDRYGIKRIFSFHSSVSAAKSFTAATNAGISSYLEDFTALHVNGEMSTKRRADHLKEFEESPKAIISNARCLTEGVNVPVADMVAFISPKKSQVDIIQAAGRAMRKSDGKEFGYILIPLFVQIAENESIEQALEKTQFAAVWDVLQAMQEQDESLEEIIGEMREELVRALGSNDNRLRERIEILGPELSIDELRKSITSRIINKLGFNWDEKFGELVRFKEVNGHCNVLRNYPENKQLATWINKQRSKYRKGNLLEVHVDKLNKINFDWNPDNTHSEEMFTALQAFKELHGHCNVPQKYSSNRALGVWVTSRRSQYKKGTLSQDNIVRLNALGFIWKTRNVQKKPWEEMFIELQKFKSLYGHCNVPQKYSANPPLGTWASGQRVLYKKGTLPAKKLSMLVGIGFDLNPMDKNWDSMFVQLIEFKELHGHCNVPNKYPNNPALGTWVYGQRSRYKRKKISKEQINKLNEIGFDWNPLDKRDIEWENKILELQKFKEINGHCNVARNYPENKQLATWVNEQRSKYRKGNLLQEHINKLNKLGFDWSPLDKQNIEWENKLLELHKFKAVNGHCNVPRNYPENKQLATWVNKQRSKYRKGSLLQEHVDKLNKIKFDWNPDNTHSEEMFAALEVFKELHGHCNVPQIYAANRALGVWVASRRSLYSKGKLSQDNIVRLNALGFIWKTRNVQKRSWADMVAELEKFKALHGHCNVPQKYSLNPSLGTWVSNLRARFRRSKLTEIQIQELEYFGFDWRIAAS